MKDLKINLVAELQIKYVPSKARKPYGAIHTSNDAYQILYPLFNPNTIRLQEQLVVLYLNNAAAVIGFFNCSIGGTDGTCVDIKIILSVALRCMAKSIILAHNHPSAKMIPSLADKKITASLKQAANFHGIELLDHLIVSANKDFYSFADQGII
jgi:DNA repair protein RadC